MAAEKPVQVTNIIPPVGLTAVPGLKTGASKTNRIDKVRTLYLARPQR